MPKSKVKPSDFRQVNEVKETSFTLPTNASLTKKAAIKKAVFDIVRAEKIAKAVFEYYQVQQPLDTIKQAPVYKLFGDTVYIKAQKELTKFDNVDTDDTDANDDGLSFLD